MLTLTFKKEENFTNSQEAGMETQQTWYQYLAPAAVR